MSWVPSPRRILTIGILVCAWCALWGSVNVANLLSGILVALGATWLSGHQQDGLAIQVWPLLKLIGLVLTDLVVSSAGIVYEVLTPTDHTDEMIIAVDIPLHACPHLLLLVVAITLTPGTAVIDTEADVGRLYLHLLHSQNAAQVTEHVQRLAQLACLAFPVRSLDDRNEQPPETSS